MNKLGISDSLLQDKRVLITGGTGSLGKKLTTRLLAMEGNGPSSILILSRDEAKQHDMRLYFSNRKGATDEVIYENFRQKLKFRIGDVRDYASVSQALMDIDVVFSAAALKQVPTCEYFPTEAVSTNVNGPANIVRAIREQRLPIEKVIGISTDKACEPINVMGMTKAIQERVFISANIDCPQTNFCCVRYGNVLASRGSVVPLFHEQVRNRQDITITTAEMTRFLLSLDRAVDTVLIALQFAEKGEIIIPRVPSARIADIATLFAEVSGLEVAEIGIRPGEKIHEILVSNPESRMTVNCNDDYYAIGPSLPELAKVPECPSLQDEYSSADCLLTKEEMRNLLNLHGLLDVPKQQDEELLT